jgi:hypothetical protein
MTPNVDSFRHGVYLQPPTGDAQQRVGPAYFSCCCRPWIVVTGGQIARN